MIPSFDWLALVLSGVASTHGVGEALLIAATAAVFGMGLSDIAAGLTERLSGGDAGPDGAGEPGFGGVDQGGGDGFGGDLDDEELGDFDDWDDQGDELDGWDDDGGLDDLGGDGGGSDLEPRLDELENEVATISSTIGTVRSENEAITETVEDIEDNIRKLLDIYEMVTRGVNPFVDEAHGGGGMGGSFGLFDDADDDGFDDLDPDIADADADSFFDDDFEEDGFDDEFAEEDFDEDPEIAATEEDERIDAGGSSASAETGSDGGGEGKTFEELKSEYEAGGVDWDEDGAEADDDADSQANADTSVDVRDDRPAAGVESPTDPASVPGVEASTGAADPSPTSDSAGDDTAAASEADRGDAGGDQTATGASDGKPYLESLPSGYGAELIVIEWLSYLRERSSTSEALRAIKYYETIDWIGAPAATSLQRYLSGLAGEDVRPATSGGTQLTIDHHTDSLRYIGKLGGKHVDIERLEWTGARGDGNRMERRGQRGIQR